MQQISYLEALEQDFSHKNVRQASQSLQSPLLINNKINQ
jgi:hypothetical protein